MSEIEDQRRVTRQLIIVKKWHWLSESVVILILLFCALAMNRSIESLEEIVGVQAEAIQSLQERLSDLGG